MKPELTEAVKEVIEQARARLADSAPITQPRTVPACPYPKKITRTHCQDIPCAI